MTAFRNPADTPCPHCGWPLAEPAAVVSRHPTTEGTVVYARCACGRLRVWLAPASGARPRLLVPGT